MTSVSHVLEALARIAPSRFAFSWDKIGLQVGDPSQNITRAVVSLDRSLMAIEYAARHNAQLLLTHHPLIFDPVGSVTSRTYEGRAIQALVRHGISHIAAHTNWDAAPGGINDALAASLGLDEIEPFGSAATSEEFKLVVFIPEEAVDKVVDVCASAGAGVIGEYRRCAFFQEGVGTFEAGAGANPTIGRPGERTSLKELRMEMVCPSDRVGAVLAACREAHPYEEPAIDLVSLRNAASHPMGRVGAIKDPMPLSEFVHHVDRSLGTRARAWGVANRLVKRIAVVGGSADTEWRAAQAAGADVLVTGEVKQHVALEAAESGFAIVMAGHFETEQPGCRALGATMKLEIPEVEWLVFEPPVGEAGRAL